MAESSLNQGTLTSQANAALRMSERPDVSTTTKINLRAASETIESLKRSRLRKKAEAETAIVTLPDNASTTEIRHARQRTSVRRGQDVYLPSWQEATYGLPNAFLRSALFSVEGSDDKALMDYPIAAQGDTTITLTGNRLLDYDRQVFAAILSFYAEDRPLSKDSDSAWLNVTFWQFIQTMGLCYGPNVHAAVRKSLVRLNAAHLRLRTSRQDIPLPHLVEVVFHKKRSMACSDDSLVTKPSDEMIALRVPQGMAELFGKGKWTKVPGLALTNYSGLPRWVTVYYKTHSKPYPLPFADLLKFSGSTCPMPEFRRRLKAALTKMMEPTTTDELRVETFVVDKANDTITVYLSRWNMVEFE